MSWQCEYDNREPYNEQELIKERMLYIRTYLDLDPEARYTVEELEELIDERIYCDEES